MATFVNDLRLTEITPGDEAGDWGATTNTNLELVAEAFSFGTEAITTNADTHTTTIADGGTDPGRSIFLKYTGTLDSACTITIGPNTVSKLWFIENGTSGSQNIIISSGSGANITIPPGDTKVVYSDGAGSGAAMVDAFASLSVVDLKVQDDLTVTGDIVTTSNATLDLAPNGTGTVVVRGNTNSGAIVFNCESNTHGQKVFGQPHSASITNTLMLPAGANSTLVSLVSADTLTNKTLTAPTLTGTSTVASLDISGDIDVDGTTNLDAVDIDGAVQLDATLTVGANDQGYDVILYGDTAARNITWDSSDDSLEFADNTKAVFGTGADAQIYFDATDFKVGATAGHLDLFASATGSSVRILGSGETLAEFTDDGDVDLFHNGSVKLSTTATGISVPGTVATTEIDSGGDLTVDAVGDIILDAAGSDLKFAVAGTTVLEIKKESGSVDFLLNTTNDDFKFKGSDDGSGVTALLLDMSEAGAATFSGSVTSNAGMSVKNGATSAGFMEFFEDSDNGTNKVTLIGPASTADVTLTLPASAGTIATTASAADDATALAIALG